MTALATAGVPVAAAPAADEPDPTCGQGSWVAGTVGLCDGVLVYRDYVYDDFGAQIAPPPAGLTGLPIESLDFYSLPEFDAYGGLPPTGAERYPEGQTNTADLVALRLWLAGDTLQVEAELNTLFDVGTSRVVVVLDADPGTATGGGPWPGVTGVSSDGWDVALVLEGGDPATNRFTGSTPRPAGDSWRVQAVTAQADGTPMNLAFRGPDERGFWWENLQADLLAVGDVSVTGHTVAVADLVDGVTRLDEPPAGAIRQRVYVSEYALGEGVSQDGVPGPGYAPGPAVSVSQAFNFLGRFQPYGFYLPDQPGPHGVQLLLHGLSENHSGRLYLGDIPGGITEQVGEGTNRILLAPLGRGWKGWWSSYSERDVFDALADVDATYEVDPDRVFAGGYSMGGYGTLRLAALYPDRFAGYMQWVGFTGDYFAGTPLDGAGGGSQAGTVGNALQLIGSLRHVPGSSLYAALDPLVLVTGGIDLRDRLVAAGIPSTFYLHPAAEHITFALLDDWRKEAADTAGFVRMRAPAHVTYRTDSRFFFPDLGIRPDEAYWVSQIVPAGPGYADVDALALGCGADEPVTTSRSAFVPDGAPVPYEETEVVVTGFQHLEPENRLELTVANVASLTVDVSVEGGACLGPGPLTYRITTSGPVTIALSDGRTLTLDGAGNHEDTLAAVLGASGAPTSSSPPADPTPALPATGGALALASGAVLAGLALAGLALAAHARAARAIAGTSVHDSRA